MSAFLRSIEVLADGEYAVTLAAPDGRCREYVFVVDDSIVPIASGPPGFEEALGFDAAKARDVYEAVLTMYKASKVEIDIDLEY